MRLQLHTFRASIWKTSGVRGGDGEDIDSVDMDEFIRQDRFLQAMVIGGVSNGISISRGRVTSNCFTGYSLFGFFSKFIQMFAYIQSNVHTSMSVTFQHLIPTRYIT